MRRSFLLLCAIFVVLTVGLTSGLAADSLSEVKVASKRVELSASAGFDKVRYFTLDSPKRLVVDLYGVQPGPQRDSFPLNNGFKTLRVGPYEDKTRFVFDVTGGAFPTFNVQSEQSHVVVTWDNANVLARRAQAEPPTVGSAQVTAIDFTSEDGKSKFLVSIRGRSLATEPVKDGDKIQFSLKNTSLPRALRRIFDTFAFPTALQSVSPYLVNVGGEPQVRFQISLKGPVSYQLEKTNEGYAFIVNDGAYARSYQPSPGVMPVPAKGAASGGMSPQPVSGTPGSMAVEEPAATGVITNASIEQVTGTSKQYTGEKTSLVFDNADVRDILRLIAEISNLNIIASDEVKGNITLRLIDVPWDQALELVLDISGLGMLQEGNVVRVLPKERIRSMKEAELTAVRSQEKLEPLETAVITVSYADLGAVSGPAKETLSERGSITEDSRNKLLIITDVPSRIEKAKELIAILDTPERQVMIEARIVQVNSNYSRDLGVNWYLQGQDSVNNPYWQGTSSAGGGFLVDAVDQNLGSLIASPGFSTQMRIGRTLINDLVLTLQLSALESDGKGKVISTPRVTTLNGETATISQGTTIPYQTSGADGPKTEFVNAELKLEVTPVINPDNSIILEILATNDSPSLTAGASAPSIDTKKAETKVLIKDGETTVIGGIYVENIQESEEGVPILMKVPVLGNFFKSQKKQTVKDELLIFITPRIMHEE